MAADFSDFPRTWIFYSRLDLILHISYFAH